MDKQQIKEIILKKVKGVKDLKNLALLLLVQQCGGTNEFLSILAERDDEKMDMYWRTMHCIYRAEKLITTNNDENI